MDFTLLVGTYTRNTNSQGIYAFKALDSQRFQPLATNSNIDNPSFLAKHPGLKVVYSVNEVSDFADARQGAVCAFKYDNGQLTLFSQRGTEGADPCHLTLSKGGDQLFVSNYSGGNFTSFPLGSDGSIAAPEIVVQHSGSGPNPDRQEQAHVHSTTLSPDDRYLYVADLGTDQLSQFSLEQGLQAQPAHVTSIEPGAGPRHVWFGQKAVYLLNELRNTITTLQPDSTDRLQVIASCTTLPEDFTAASDSAHIQGSSDGRFLYTTNRGHDSVAVFEIQQQGIPELIQLLPTGGKHPRHFAFSPDQCQLLIANRDTHNINIFERDADTGRLTALDVTLEVPSPVFLLPITS